VEGRPLDEGALVERAKQGDIDAYEELVHRHQLAAIRLAWAIGAGADAEDAVQDAFVKAFAALGRFRPGAPFRPWLLRIVANETRNRQRRAGRQARLALRETGARPSGDAAPSPEEAVLDRERRRRLLAAVESLPERDRLVVACRYFAELSEAETASALGWPIGTVKSRLSRALARLRPVVEGER
jgi:RNA polymerase sigma factor (sigma-70 family)